MTVGPSQDQPSVGTGPSQAELNKMMVLALEDHQSGRLEEAEDKYRRVLQLDPNQPHALHLLGVIAYQAGQPEAAVQLISRAIALLGNVPDFHNNIGEAYRALGLHDDAINHYRRAMSLQPVNPGAACNMGSALLAQGKVREAMVEFKKAIGFKPDFAEAKAKLGAAIIRLPKDDPGRDLDKGIELLRLGIRLNPSFVEGYVNLANALAEKDEFDEARDLFKQAVERDPRNVEAQFNLACLLLDQNEIYEGAVAMDRALELAPENVDLIVTAGDAFVAIERYRPAIMCFRKATELAPENTVYFERLGNALAETGWKKGAAKAYEHVLAQKPERTALRFELVDLLMTNNRIDDARNLVEELMETEPDNMRARLVLGRLLQRKGLFEEAAAHFLEVHEHFPDAVAPIHNLLTDRNYEPADEHIQILEGIASNHDLDDDARSLAHMDLGDTYHRRKEYDQAFSHYEAGNALVYAEQQTDPANLPRRHRAMTTIYNAAFFAERWAYGDDSERPVFVVGLPRSGTTLTEQIIGSHPLATGAGELLDLPHISRFMNIDMGSPRQYPLCVPELDQAMTRRFAHQYLEGLDEVDTEALRVVDKLPGNFEHIGLIGLLFPNAKIINLRRNPMDNCLSCFLQHFQRGIGFMWRLEDLGAYYRFYRELMDYWHTVKPVEILDVHYEELVANPEEQSRRMIEFIGLDWDPACLEYHKTDSTVVTASVWQARQPVYKSSVAGWKRYEKHLGPLIEALGEYAEV